MVKNYSVVGVHWGLYRTQRPEVLAEAWQAIMSAGVSPLIGAVRPLTEAASALDDLAAGRTTGKTIVSCS
jgi:NADPH2:quinone reductase